ncbi:MAG: sigma 54-interacting transcriptional regulator [Planctomycetaceae bacterium]|nr:sigma 54-interacting transcriptional regulator [Planctomycetaceae bacterium]
MDSLRSLVAAVWREVGRHLDLQQSTAGIAALLASHLPVDQLWIRRFDPDQSCLETVATANDTDGSPLNVRQTVAPDAMRSLLAWCRRQTVLHRGQSIAPPAKLLFAAIDGDALAGPLGDPSDPHGVLVLAAPRGRRFNASHVHLIQQLLEPFSSALENDLQVRRMATLSEAAEADKQSLLHRLGRKSIGDTIVGVDSGLRAVMERVELVAPSDAPVLIFGETGTGKEVIARAIHRSSSRRDGPFDRVNCGAIPPELIDSQLFGHERGAFTGAVESRRGWFERAHGGTLFLDEIGELPLAAQVRMLRILQDGWMERVGGEKPIHVDVRIIAATHRDLASMVADGRFREDLWYRIAIFPIVLPPLRERREDIPNLATHFAQKAATRFGLATVSPSDGDLALLSRYDWPGNVRELGAVIDRAAILGDGRRLDVATALGIDATSRAGRAIQEIHEPPSSAPPSDDVPFLPTRQKPIESLDAAIRRHIESALRITLGRIEGRYGAAALLEINPHTLRAKMRKLGIDWTRFRDDAKKPSPPPHDG